MTPPLKLYTTILPRSADLGPKALFFGYMAFEDLLSDLSGRDGHTAIFDCRSLPTAFVEDTGLAFWQEREETKRKVRLPRHRCYFEFSGGFSVWAGEVDFGGCGDFVEEDGDIKIENLQEPPTIETLVEVNGFSSYGPFPHAPEHETMVFENGSQEWLAGERGEYFLPSSIDSVLLDDDDNRRAGLYLIGILGLLEEKLVSEVVKQDPRPWLSDHRIKTGRPPTAGTSRVLTVNVPAARRVAATAKPIGTHESPALHWRRGHWRALHRGSEFESKVWVRQCLVGDPDKGFIKSTYRLTHRMPMFAIPAEQASAQADGPFSEGHASPL